MWCSRGAFETEVVIILCISIVSLFRVKQGHDCSRNLSISRARRLKVFEETFACGWVNSLSPLCSLAAFPAGRFAYAVSNEQGIYIWIDIGEWNCMRSNSLMIRNN